MNREIKFRAWHKKNRKIYTVVTLCLDRLDDELVELNLKEHSGGRYFDTFGSKNIVLMQYTGLKDKEGKGKEVYFDDIAKDEHGQVFLIEWDYPLLARLQEMWFEVIGNIYENSELLKEK